MSVQKKLRVLCLHGYHQNEDLFRQKTGSFRKPLKKYVDFEFLNAPHLLEDKYLLEKCEDPAYLLKTSPDASSDARGWWLKYAPEEKSDGLQESLEVLKKFLQNSGPFDGIVGFSQGAAFLTLACILLKETILSASVRFVIIVAGFKSLLPSHQQHYQSESKISFPSLHVIGNSDEVICPDRSRELLELFLNGQVITHPGGHYVPASKDLREIYKTFIEQFLSQS